MKKLVLGLVITAAAVIIILAVLLLRTCPSYPTVPGWCANGTIINPGNDSYGCPLPPNCMDSQGQHHVQIMNQAVCSAANGNWWLGECRCGGTKGYMCPMGWECVTGGNVAGPDGVCKMRQA
jgi:hypothetical protein